MSGIKLGTCHCIQSVRPSGGGKTQSCWLEYLSISVRCVCMHHAGKKNRGIPGIATIVEDAKVAVATWLIVLEVE